MERLSSLDATFLAIEDVVNHMHIASVGIFEGPAPSARELSDVVAGKLGLVPRYRQKVLLAPGYLGRPVWVDDPHFTLSYHIRHTALPAPGGHEELRNLVGRVMSQQLDRHKPLWETWMVEGLGDGHWALITKIHHSMVDGIAGTDLLATVLDLEPAPARSEPEPWQPAPEPTSLQLALHSLRSLATGPIGIARGVGGALRHPHEVVGRAADVSRGALRLATTFKPVPKSSFTGPIGPHRRWDFARASLADVKTIRNAFGGTVNDVVLAVATRGLRDLLLSRGESVEDRVLRSLVPVSVRPPDARGVYDNRVSVMFAELPVGIADPTERLAAIHDQMEQLKSSKEIEAAAAFTASAGLAPPMGVAWVTRVAVHNQPVVETVTTNVPGPQFPLYACGRRMLEMFPYVPVAGRVRVTIGILSYDGGLGFGVTGDYDAAHDIDVVCAGIEDGMSELLKAASDTAQ